MKIILQRFVLSIVKNRQSLNCCKLMIPVILINIRVLLKLQSFFTRKDVTHHSCLLVEHCSWNMFCQEICNIFQWCFALRPGPSRCIMALALVLSVRSSILNERAVWCSSRCFTYKASMQPFVIALASDSAEDSDTVASVTYQCRTVKHRPIANTPQDVEHLVFGSPAQSAPTVTWMTSSSFPTQGKFSTHRWRPLR